MNRKKWLPQVLQFRKSRQIEVLQEQLKNASDTLESLQKELSELKEYERSVRIKNITQIKGLLLKARKIDCEQLDGEALYKMCCFPVNENTKTGKWHVSMNICSLGGCEFNDYEFLTKREAFQFGYILTQLGEKPETGAACSDCYSEYEEKSNA